MLTLMLLLKLVNVYNKVNTNKYKQIAGYLRTSLIRSIGCIYFAVTSSTIILKAHDFNSLRHSLKWGIMIHYIGRHLSITNNDSK